MTNDQLQAMVEEMKGHAEAFDRILLLNETKHDWKAPINCVVVEPDATIRRQLAEAVEHYTATEAVFTPLGDGAYHVQAVGYRMGPAGDH